MTPTAPPPYELVETPERLRRIGRLLETESAVAVDLEADSMFHFQERVCLLQVATPRLNGVIDPLALPDLTALQPFFANPGIEKILHGADYDIRSLYRDFAIRVANLFDTELACRFMGMASTGLDAVLEQRFDIRLNKKFQKKDWSQRPLPAEMLDYAAGDTAHLLPLALWLKDQLRQRGRLGWVREECELLSRVRPADSGEEPLFLRFKGAGRLSRRSLAVLEAILQVRWDTARRLDRPLFKVIDNATVMRLVEATPVHVEQLAAGRLLTPRQIRLVGRAVVEAVDAARQLPPADLPRYPRRRSPRLDPAVPQRMQRLKVWRDACAADLELDAGLVCNRALMTAIAVRLPREPEELREIPGLRDWQRDAFGADIVEALQAV